MNILFTTIFLMLALAVPVVGAHAAEGQTNISARSMIAAEQNATKAQAEKILFIGDSMTGWMAERLNAYGVANSFETATIVWDGSTIKKWGSAASLRKIISAQKPDVIFVSLGLNELFEKHPEATLGKYLDNIIKAAGDTPIVWVGPPSWPGHKDGEVLDQWLRKRLEDSGNTYFSSLHLDLARQSRTNPHPSRPGIVKWIDTLTEWLPQNAPVAITLDNKPAAAAMSRGKTFIYKRMKETL